MNCNPGRLLGNYSRFSSCMYWFCAGFFFCSAGSLTQGSFLSQACTLSGFRNANAKRRVFWNAALSFLSLVFLSVLARKNLRIYQGLSAPTEPTKSLENTEKT